MKRLILSALWAAMAMAPAAAGAQTVDGSTGATARSAQQTPPDEATRPASRLLLGGYGEAVMSRMFYSSNYKRYTNASLYSDADGYGQFDIPHVVFFVGYDFGRGWTMNSEIEFEHGGTESAIEIEEETGEYESEIERGGEVAIEQFWLQKSFSDALNVRVGHMVVPVGRTNAHHMPTEFFTVYRPEGESTILPCTWHETGLSLWGQSGQWRYEAMFLAGLDADRFGSQNWVGSGAGSPYEFKMGTCYAGAFRIDNTSVPGLQLSLSGYVGTSASNSLKPDAYSKVKGLVTIGSLDFMYGRRNCLVRGGVVYGHLTDSEKITAINMSTRSDSPSPKTPIASDAMAASVEAGYDLFSLAARQVEPQLFAFVRYDFYDSMFRTEGSMTDNECWGRQCVVAGFNYFPIRDLVVKAEFSHRIFRSQYNNENTLSFGIAYSGMFNL